jgi:HAD superfamily hydrolase (TIGR01662 family)
MMRMKFEVPEATQIQLLKPIGRVVRPDFSIANVHNLSVRAIDREPQLKPVGLIIFDVDNTLEDYLSPELLPETIDLLQRLRGAGYRLALASNCDKERGDVLKELFANLVDVVATPQDAKDMRPQWGKKPTTGMYDYIQETFRSYGMNFSSAQTVMVGDQLLKDMLFGKLAHTKTILTGKF